MRPALRQILFANRWTPNQLFGASDTGDWWDVSNSAHIWTTSGATVNAGDGSVVGRIDGLKNGHNLTQGTTSAKPVRHLSGGQWYLTTDSVNDYLSGAFTLAQPFTRISAIQQLSWLSAAHIFDGPATVNTGALLQNSTTPTIAEYAGGTAVNTTALAVGANGVVTEIFNGASSEIAVNNGSYVTGSPGAGNPGGLIIGTGGGPTTQWSNINFYGAILIGRVLTDAEIAKCRTYFGRLAGLSL